MTHLKDANIPSSEKLETEAAHWLAKLDACSFFDGEAVDLDIYASRNAEFAAWLSASVSHRVALLRLVAVWKRSQRLAVLKSPELAHTEPVGAWRAKFSSPGRLFGAAVAASLLLVSAFAMIGQLEPPTDNVHQTERGQQKTVSLADGSTVVLNSDTKFTVQMSEKERLILLEKGEAVFEVRRNESRPFKVVAADQVVTVLGTKFAVHRKAGEVEIAVTEGKVQIDTVESLKGESPPVVVRKGDIAKTDQGTVLVINQGLETVIRELSWRQGFIIFDKMPLSEAAAEFNRYNDGALIVQDPQIASIHVSGRFKTDNLAAFVRLLTEGFGFKATYLNDDILISG